MLLELGDDPGLAEELGGLADRSIYLGANPIVRRAVRSRWKGLGEATGLAVALSSLSSASHVIKLSGRYELSADFSPSSFLNRGFSFRCYGRFPVVSTRLYGVSAESFPEWRRALLLSTPYLLAGESLERSMPRWIESSSINHIPRLGVRGRIGTNGELIDE